MKHSPKQSAGFSLVELMVALVIALISIAAATEIYISSRQTNRIQGMQSRLAEDGRYAISMLQRMISQAGYRPNPNILIASDFITPVSSESVTIKFTADGVSSVACDGTVPAANAVQTITIAKSGGKLQCGAVDWLAPSSAGTGNGTELVDFALKFGTDTGPTTVADLGCGADVGTALKDRDCVADTYVLATALANPAKIVAIRACVVLRTEAVDSSVVKAAVVKGCDGVTDIAGSLDDHKIYRTFRTTIQLRNR